MKTIEEKAIEFNNSKTNGYHPQPWVTAIFKAGAACAQRWITIEEELPEENITVLAKNDVLPGRHIWISVITKNGLVGLSNPDYGTIQATHWRLIEIK